MNATYPNQTVATMASSAVEDDRQDQNQGSGFLYQAATILAILLLLFSF